MPGTLREIAQIIYSGFSTLFTNRFCQWTRRKYHCKNLCWLCKELRSDWIIIAGHQYWVNNVIGLMWSNNLYCITAKHNPSGTSKWGLHMWTVGPHLERTLIAVRSWLVHGGNKIDTTLMKGIPTPASCSRLAKILIQDLKIYSSTADFKKCSLHSFSERECKEPSGSWCKNIDTRRYLICVYPFNAIFFKTKDNP